MKDTPTKDYREDPIKAHALFISIVVRNAIEDFHCKHLSDKQMAELNPLIRNAVYTALYASHFSGESERWDSYIKYQCSMIPPYWEEPRLLEGLREFRPNAKTNKK